MLILTAIILALLAGMMNGSYPAPIRMIRLPFDTIWLIFSIFMFLIFPWIAVWILSPNDILKLFASLPTSFFMITVGAGLIYGCGMLVYTYSLHYVGIGVSFLLNIAGGTIIGSLLPVLLLNASKLITPSGIWELVAMGVFLVGLIAAGIASTKRAKNAGVNQDIVPGKSAQGILLGILSGIFCAAQGSAYSYTLPAVNTLAAHLSASPLAAAMLAWIPIFNGAFVPFFLYFLIKNIRSKTWQQLQNKVFTWVAFIFGMAVLAFGSLIVFSKAAISLGQLGSVIVWPIFMISIILTSNFWGWRQGEWRNSGSVAGTWQITSIAFLVLAVAALVMSAYYNILSSPYVASLQ
jgi:L-rhamnose-H+ transport protein